VTGLRPEDIKPQVRTMTRYGIAYLQEGDWEDEWWVTTYLLDGWDFWSALREFCGEADLDLHAFIGDLRFDLLDR
jgi:hypothetical protein